ncbi:hypothetical protein [Bosea sp. RAC05]|uniref:hypothetical protein n=1 Tax=Bosea sp. RAC05 TaxID=1842539 RepID=UPI00083E56F2|nr:hypothetical protein [Bosea sp. RAC05]AOG02869.1 putative membrane protein [Bosea sp. RAC05]
MTNPAHLSDERVPFARLTFGWILAGQMALSTVICCVAAAIVESWAAGLIVPLGVLFSMPVNLISAFIARDLIDSRRPLAAAGVLGFILAVYALPVAFKFAQRWKS